jgi:tetratricopeptide (TPR) repeat protein
MSDVLRGDTAHAHEPALDADRDAKIEQLLLVGLDHYFAAQYDQAINVWTRALFLDRSHPRARAYIERARSAVAERQRQSEELLHSGVAAFHRGDGDEARRLLKAAIDGGAPSEEALALLERLDRLETAAPSRPSPDSRRERQTRSASASRDRSRSTLGFAATLTIVAVILAMGGYAATSDGATAVWKSWLALQTVPQSTAAPPPVVREQSLALPRRGEMALMRARALAATGHLSDALVSLDAVRPTDAQRADADRLRADIQRQLLALVPAGPSAPAEREKGDRRVP